MINARAKFYKMLLLCSPILFAASPAFAYLGPGAGLGMIGSLIAIVVVGLVIVLGLVVYPIRMLRKRNAESIANENKSSTSD